MQGRFRVLALLTLIGMALVWAYALPGGYHLFILADDDLSDDNLWDLNQSLPNGFMATPVDPYIFSSPDSAGHFVFHQHETPIAHWVAPVRFARSPPSSIC